MTRLQALKEHLRPGQVYRREDLARWSNAVDRHIRQLQDEGTLTKLAGGLYAYPKDTVFGKAPAEDAKPSLSALSSRITAFFWPLPTPITGLESERRSFTTRRSFIITSDTACSR
jgi:hypothetical protein